MCIAHIMNSEMIKCSFPVGKIAEKAVWRNAFLYCPTDCFFGYFAHWI